MRHSRDHSNRLEAIVTFVIACVVVCSAVGTSSRAAEPTVLEGHTNAVSSVAFSRDGQRVISGSWDKTVRIWNVESGKPEETLEGHRDWVFDVAALDDGSLVSASQRTIRSWNATPAQLGAVQPSLGGPTVNALAFSNDGKLLAAGGRDGVAKVWRAGATSPMATFGGFESWVSCVAVADNREVISVGTRTGRIRAFDLTTKKESPPIAGYDSQQVLAMAINPAGDTLASGGIDPTIRLWDLETGKEISKLTGHKGVVTAIAWSADGKRLASGERHGQIKVWDHGGANEPIANLAGHSDKRLGFTVTCLAFSPNGQLLVSGSYDKTLKIWTLAGD